MRVLHVVPSFHPARVYGGPIGTVYALCRRLARLGCEVRVFTTNADGPEAVLPVENDREVAFDGFRVRYFPRRFGEFFSPALLASLPAAIRRADVIHVTGLYSFTTIPALALGKLFEKPVVLSPRGALNGWAGQRRKRLKRAWEAVCRIASPRNLRFHVTSEEEQANSRARFPTSETVLIGNGVELPPPAPRARVPGTLRILYLGRLHPIKAVDNLIAACAQLNAKERIEWSLVIAGAGDAAYTERLRQMIARHGLSSRARLIGEVTGEAREAAFRESDLLVLPSHSENFGMAVAEALARGVPAIAGKNTPWKRLESMGCGLWVENDPASLAGALRRISKMPLEEMGARGRAWMEREFGWERKAAEMLRVYRELAGMTASPALESSRSEAPG